MRRYLVASLVLAMLGWIWQINPGLCQDKKKILPAMDWGSLSGRCVFNGQIPIPESLVAKMKAHADSECCLAGKESEKFDGTWLVDPKTKGVANVLVCLKAPAGTYFPIHKDDLARKDTVIVDQPNCQFTPRMSACFPSYFNGEEQVPTGQKFQLKNSAIKPHNIRASTNPLLNAGFNIVLHPGTKHDVVLNPQPMPITLNCDLHTWMNAFVAVFDHPYFAVTKEDGSFEIPRVPAGVKLNLWAYHDGVGYVLGKNGREITFETGKNVIPDIKINAPEIK